MREAFPVKLMLQLFEATPEEQAAIRAMLSRRAASAPAGAGVGRAPALAWAGLKLAAIVLLAAGVGIGLGDGDEFDDVGCSVAQQPGGTSHGVRSAKTRERAGGKVPGSVGGSAGGSGDGGPYGGKAETLKAESRNATTDHGLQDYAGKAAEGLRTTGPPTTGLRGQEGETFPINLLKQVLDSTTEELAVIERILGGRSFSDWQKGVPRTQQRISAHRPRPTGAFKAAIEGDPTSGSFSIRVSPANQAAQAAPPEPAEPDAPNLSLAAKVLKLLTALDPENRLRKAPPIKVFNLYYRQRLGAAEIARKCDCDRSLIYDRLAAIQEKVPWTPEQLREVSPHVEAMQDAISDSRARSTYRKGLSLPTAFFGLC